MLSRRRERIDIVEYLIIEATRRGILAVLPCFRPVSGWLFLRQ